MKILYYTHSYFLDCDLPLIKEFRKAGHDIYFVMELVPYSLHSTLVNIDKQLPNVGIIGSDAYTELLFLHQYLDKDKIFILNRPCKIYSLKNIKLRFEFYKLIHKINPDIIHCTDFIDIIDLFLYKYRRKIVQIVHDPFPHSGEYTRRKYINRYIAFKRLSNYVLLNSKQKDTFVKKYSLNNKSVFTNQLSIYECIHLYKSNNSCYIKKRIFFWGRISPYKGIEYLLQSMIDVIKKQPDSELIVAGGGKYYFDLTPYTDYKNIKIINRYLSMQEIYNYLSSSSFVVCPYINATQSGVIMTAFALLKPVIATNVGGLPEMVKNGKTGIIIPPKDISALTQAIIKLLSDTQYRDKLSNNIKKIYYCNGEQSWEKIMNKYITIYKTILS